MKNKLLITKMLPIIESNSTIKIFRTIQPVGVYGINPLRYAIITEYVEAEGMIAGAERQF